MPDGCFSGLLVVNLPRVLAGPFCMMMPAELDARVIKVENPQRGDDSHRFEPFLQGQSSFYASRNRGKESIALDRKDGAGPELNADGDRIRRELGG
ncbi:MAG TPA: CoA transferase [Gemmataceae bacterium]|jgi:CoA:oxalate CoA-transferase